MTENKYRVVLTGKVADGKSEKEVAARMAGLFKTSPDKIGMLLKKQGVVIKQDIDLETAKKYAGAILSTGAICIIDPPEKQAPAGKMTDASPGAGQPADAVVAASHKDRSEPRVVVIPLSQKPEDRFTPRPVEKLSAASGGIDFNVPDAGAVPLAQITAVAAFSESSTPEESTRLFIFVKNRPAPFICKINHIAYEDFPVKVFPKHIASFRGFLHFLCKENPSIILEEATLDFLSGSQPQVLDPGKVMKLATGLGMLIESGDVDAQT
jgi:hypothetical protein